MKKPGHSADIAEFKKVRTPSKVAPAPVAPVPDIGNTDKLLTRKEAAALLGVCSKTLQNLDAEGAGPALIRLTEKRVAYLQSDLAAWVASRRRAKSAPADAAA